MISNRFIFIVHLQSLLHEIISLIQNHPCQSHSLWGKLLCRCSCV
jgi:hypothetical protein